MNYLILTVKGFFVGIALIIPGLSGGTLAIYLGIYEKLLHSIGHVFSEFRKSLEFLIPVFFGMAISIVALANLLGYLIDLNSFIVLLFFMGLVVGGMNDIYKRANPTNQTIEPSGIIAFAVSFLVIILLVIFGKLGNDTGIAYIEVNILNMLLLIVLGMAASITMIVPGISGSALLIVLGYYTAIVTNVIGNVFDFSELQYNLSIIIPFAIGAGIGIILFSNVIEHMLKHYASQTYYAILGFLVGSVIAIFFEIKDPSTGATHDVQTPIVENFISFLGDNIWSLIGAIVFFAIGFVLSLYMVKVQENR